MSENKEVYHVTVCFIIITLLTIIYLQHLELMHAMDRIGPRSAWAQTVESIEEPIDHIYIETRALDKGLRVE